MFLKTTPRGGAQDNESGGLGRMSTTYLHKLIARRLHLVAIVQKKSFGLRPREGVFTYHASNTVVGYEVSSATKPTE